MSLLNMFFVHARYISLKIPGSGHDWVKNSHWLFQVGYVRNVVEMNISLLASLVSVKPKQ